MRFIVFISAFVGLIGCSSLSGGDFTADCRNVHHLGGGVYVVDYRWPYVEKVFGRDLYKAVPAYLEAKNLVPSACSSGVVVVGGGEVEGGWGWARFRCKSEAKQHRIIK